MVDLLKIVTFDGLQIEKVWGNPLLVFNSNKDYLVDDEIRSMESKTYKNLIFKRYQNRLEILGSIHYLWNNGLHNANDFRVKDCIQTINFLINSFKINPTLFKVIGIEFGFNFNPERPVNEVLKSLKFYNKKHIREGFEIPNFYLAGNAYKMIKIYNKSQDFPLYAESNTMRFEVKTKLNQRIKKLGINLLSDLLLSENYIELNKEILREWRNVLIFDYELDHLNNYQITEYWLSAINNYSRNTFYNRKKAYLSKLPENSLFFQIEAKLIQKGDCAFLDYN